MIFEGLNQDSRDFLALMNARLSDEDGKGRSKAKLTPIRPRDSKKSSLQVPKSQSQLVIKAA